MEHLFLPYELAKLAEEKGFTAKMYFAWKFRDGSSKENHYQTLIKFNFAQIGIPLYNQIIDWFDKKGIYIEVLVSVYSEPLWYDWCIECKEDIFLNRYSSEEEAYSTRTEALNKAIQEAFLLI